MKASEKWNVAGNMPMALKVWPMMCLVVFVVNFAQISGAIRGAELGSDGRIMKITASPTHLTAGSDHVYWFYEHGNDQVQFGFSSETSLNPVY